MVLPLGLLNAAKNRQITIELKNGDLIRGTMVNCDSFMNILLKPATFKPKALKEATEFEEFYVKGSLIKHVKLDSNLIAEIKTSQLQHRNDNRKFQNDRRDNNNRRGDFRGGRGGFQQRGQRGGFRNYNNQGQNDRESVQANRGGRNQ